MILTINITGTPPPGIPIHHTNLIFGMGVSWGGGQNSVRERNRYINSFDVFEDMSPRFEYSDDYYYIEIMDIGYVDASNNKVSDPNMPVYFGGGSPVQVGHQFSKDQLGFNLNQGDFVYIDGYNSNLTGLIYIDYRVLDDQANPHIDSFTLFIAKPKGVEGVFTTITYDKTLYVEGGSVTAIRMDDIQEFDFDKTSYQLIVFYNQQTVQEILNHYPMINKNHTTKIFFFQDGSYNTDNRDPYYNQEYVLGGNLFYEGHPVKYGQAINIDKTNVGQLILNTGNLPSGEVQLFIGIEGYFTGGIFTKS